ncbi:hypothetical protein M3Y94_00863900 [Aphelenchoides besseyi]|nr:hypothetical protein M3Y94_00863900 [Aphelenchoides besseyi]
MGRNGCFHWATRLQMIVCFISIVMITYSLLSLVRITRNFIDLTNAAEANDSDIFELLLKNVDIFGNTMAVFIVSVLLLYGNLTTPPSFYLTFIILNAFVIFHWLLKTIYSQFNGNFEVNNQFFGLTTFVVQIIFVATVWLARSEALTMRKFTTDSMDSKAQLCLYDKTIP